MAHTVYKYKTRLAARCEVIYTATGNRFLSFLISLRSSFNRGKPVSSRLGGTRPPLARYIAPRGIEPLLPG